MPKNSGYALVTGASQGLGKAIALELARHGYGMLLTARSGEALRATATEAEKISGKPSHVLEQDLFAPDAATRIAQWALGLNVELTCLVNNAGQGLWGMFTALSAEEQLAMMRLNMDVPVALTHALLPALQKQPRSHLLNISSMTAYSAMATFATYSASKAFVRVWSRSLRIELEKGPVSVTVVCPGSIITGFTQRARMMAMDQLARKFGSSPEVVAKSSVKAMLSGKAEVVPGLLNRITAGVQGILPDALNERMASGIYLKRLPAGGAE
ncbi:MAG: SDR family NAD(P)-dependent oxidoreductase [Flavobacteriales bacterium]|jgi:short-subunit dehydrogenase|nr:SDR family NAD(P)-dependent oxidoreductase [Flavobacteriales bacterium]MCI1754130.1 SDR family NAD(P)-dependent oxidoreductase [Flavobacteriales bacterium]